MVTDPPELTAPRTKVTIVVPVGASINKRMLPVNELSTIIKLDWDTRQRSKLDELKVIFFKEARSYS